MSNIKGCLLSYDDVVPSVDSTAFVAHNAYVIGAVSLSGNVSIWYGAVLRGDVDKIFVGEGTNIQDLTVVHTDSEHGDTQIGKFVTVGHSCILHACTVKDKAFVGMGSIVMDRAIIEEEGMLAAGSLLTKGKVVGSRELWAGRPAKFMRCLTDEEVLHLQRSSENYVRLSRRYIDKEAGSMV